MSTTTTMLRKEDVKREWYLIDAASAPTPFTSSRRGSHAESGKDSPNENAASVRLTVVTMMTAQSAHCPSWYAT